MGTCTYLQVACDLQPPSPFSHSHHLLYPSCPHYWPTTLNYDPWTVPERMKITKENPHHCESIQNGMPITHDRLHRWSLSGRSFQDALRSFFQPTKADDPRIDFYTVYGRQAAEYDMDYVGKYGDDLNTAMIFVRLPSFALVASLTRSRRPVCLLLSAQHLPSMSIPNYNQIQTNNPPLSSAQSSSLSITPLSLVRPP